MPLFGPPNVSTLLAKKDFAGLIKALGYANDQGQTRQAAAKALIQLGSLALPALRKALNDPNPAIRTGVCFSLQEIGNPTTLPDLLQTLSDDSNAVRQAAQQSIEHICAHFTPNPLLKLLSTDPPHLAEKAAIALGNMKDTKSLPLLIEMLDSPNHHQRMAATHALEKMGNTTIPALSDAIQHRSEDARRCAAQLLGKTADPNAIPGLLTALDDPSEYVFLEVAHALASFGTPAALPLLRLFLIGAPETRPRAGKALQKLGAAAEPAFRTALQRGDSESQQRVASLLGGIEQPWVAPLLIEQLRSSDEALRYAALQSLGQQSTPIFIPVFLKALNDPSPYVQDCAAHWLQTLQPNIQDPLQQRQVAQALQTHQRSIS